MTRYLTLTLTALLLTGCFDSKPDNKLQAQLPPGATLNADGTVLAQGRVVGVSDGDTLTVLASNKQSYKIRLQGIDAPEKAQPFGQKCKEALMTQAINLTATVEAHKLDRYGRVLGKVTVEGQDVALTQIQSGCGWHYTAYMKEQSKDDQIAYAAAEKQARKAKRGLWKDKQPQAPWDFRKHKVS
ncbi:thermonuclease family protein [Thiothrix lacustris]|uniref:Thermonuclease family protein n=1 Tax=Thiothrix lacustris TaxID=525917 RepID=A0ABY9MPZ3_9GAMM|nr:thermonuclease family protein [Thiothrix lacustris]WML90633.1 thermonuclease family protein [Thiothrix lacustris]